MPSARIVANDSLTPPLRMDERMEAAIGLAQMRPEKNKDYQPAYAAQQIAFFLDEFALYYNDRANHRRPSQVYAVALAEAIEALKNDTKDPYILALFDSGRAGQQLLFLMEKGSPGANGNMLKVDAETKQPQPAQLFSSIADSKARAAKKD